MDKDEQFTRFHEYCLALCRRSGFGDSYRAKEQMAWDLHAAFPPAGSVALGNLLLDQRTSYLEKTPNVAGLGKQLLAAAFAELEASVARDAWDEYYLGECHAYGRGTPQSHELASVHFTRAEEMGNPYASFEAIWCAYLAGGPRLVAIGRLRDCSGPIEDYAKASAQALALMEAGPVLHLGSSAHLFRILELSRLRNAFLYQNQGSRLLRVEIGKEMKGDLDRLASVETPGVRVASYLLASRGFGNPEGREVADLLREAVRLNDPGLLALCEAGEIGEEGLKVIIGETSVAGDASGRLHRISKAKLAEFERQTPLEREARYRI
jgi:hypothetical protein